MQKNSLLYLKELTDRLIDRDFILKRKQYMFEKLLEASPLHVLAWTTDEDMRFNYASGSIPTIEDPEEFLGMSISEFLELYSENEFEKVNDSLVRCLTDHVTLKFLCRINERKIYTVCSPLYNYHNEIVGIIGLSWDVTELMSISEILQHVKER